MGWSGVLIDEEQFCFTAFGRIKCIPTTTNSIKLVTVMRYLVPTFECTACEEVLTECHSKVPLPFQPRDPQRGEDPQSFCASALLPSPQNGHLDEISSILRVSE